MLRYCEASLWDKPWGETRYTSGTTPTQYQYTGQRNEVSIGLYFYNARWYDSLTGRFAQADTIIPGGVQGLDRYAYANNNPLYYTDPTGHTNQCNGYWDSGCHKGENGTIVVLACGIDVDCEHGTENEEYDNNIPLSDARDWAEENGYDWYFFNFNDTVINQATDIVDFMNIYPDANFILIGHSFGAAAVVQAASMYTNNGKDTEKADNILGVAVLDMLIYQGNDLSRKDTQDGIEALIKVGIPFAPYNSTAYEKLSWGSDALPTGSDMIWGWLKGAHYALAIDHALFTNKIIPTFESWRR